MAVGDRPAGFDAPPGYAAVAVGGLLLAGAAVWTGGPLGVLVAGLALAGWVLVAAPVGIGLAHLGVLALAPGPAPASLPAVLALETGLGVLLVAELRVAGGREAAAGVVAYAAFGVVLAVALGATPAVWLAGLGLAVAVAAVAYGLHRVETVALEDLDGVDPGVER